MNFKYESVHTLHMPILMQLYCTSAVMTFPFLSSYLYLSAFTCLYFLHFLSGLYCQKLQHLKKFDMVSKKSVLILTQVSVKIACCFIVNIVFCTHICNL